MKKRIEFRIELLEMIFIVVILFGSGLFFMSDLNDKYVYSALLLFSAGILIVKNRNIKS